MPSNNTDDTSGSTEIEVVASNWIVKRARGLTRREQAALAKWLKEDPRHLATFEALEATWGMLAEARGDSFRQRGPSASSHRRRFAWAAIAAGLLVTAGIVQWQPSPWPDPHREHGLPASVASTGADEIRAFELADGSVIQLNAASRVEVQFDARERKLHLVRGEASFSVRKDQDRPFVVMAGNVKMRAVGTAFNVRLTGSSVELLVTEGKVQVATDPAPATGLGSEMSPAAGLAGSPGSDGSPVSTGNDTSLDTGAPYDLAPLVVAGHRMTVNFEHPQWELKHYVVTPVESEAIADTLAWQKQQLDFSSTPLREIVAEFNRYNTHKIVIMGDELGSQLFGGSFLTSDVESLIRLLENNYNITAIREEGRTLLRLDP